MLIHTLNENELDRWVEHCASVFQGESDTPDYFKSHYLMDPWRDPEGVFIAEVDGVIAATVRVFTRSIYLKGRDIKIGGIGEVSTKPEFRRQGLSGKLLERACQYMVKRDMPISLLFTGTNRHYARYGWFTAPRRSVRLALDQAPALVEGAELAPVTEGDWAAVRGLYHLTTGRFDGAMVRDHPSYWDQWIRKYIEPPIALKRDGVLLAYMALHRDEGRVSLAEYATHPELDPWREMLRAELTRTGEPLEAYVPSPLCPGESGPFAEDTGGMFRLNKPFYLGDQFIERPGQLLGALSEYLFWSADGF